MDCIRRLAISTRLDDGYTVQDIIDAINGCCLSPWNQGDNSNNQRYDDISLICKSAAQIDRFIEIYEKHINKLNLAEEKKDYNQVSDVETARRNLERIRKMLGRL